MYDPHEKYSIVDVLRTTGLFDCRLDLIDSRFKGILNHHISWLPGNGKHLKPECGVLDIKALPFLHLPASISSINEVLDKMIELQKSVDWAEITKCSRPAVMLTKSAQALKADLKNDDQDTARRRLKEIHRFASGRWPGWYESILDDIIAELDRKKYDKAEKLIDVVADNSESVEYFSIIQTFFHGLPKDIVNHGLGPCLTSLEFYLNNHDEAGIVDEKKVHLDDALKPIRMRNWWDFLQNALNNLVKSWEDDKAENAHVLRLRGNVESAKACIDVIGSILNPIFNGGCEISNKALEEACKNMRKLAIMMQELREEERRIRSLLQREMH